jgi:hypothetical protein
MWQCSRVAELKHQNTEALKQRNKNAEMVKNVAALNHQMH